MHNFLNYLSIIIIAFFVFDMNMLLKKTFQIVVLVQLTIWNVGSRHATRNMERACYHQRWCAGNRSLPNAFGYSGMPHASWVIMCVLAGLLGRALLWCHPSHWLALFPGSFWLVTDWLHLSCLRSIWVITHLCHYQCPPRSVLGRDSSRAIHTTGSSQPRHKR